MIESLEEEDRLDNTVFIVTSDNGWSFLEHRVFGKGDAYNPSTRVPLFVMSQNHQLVSTTASIGELVSQIDITATILELAQAQPEAGIRLNGVSFASLLRDPKSGPTRLDLLIEVGVGRDAPAGLPRRRPDWSAIVTSDQNPTFPGMKYIEYASGERELYFEIEDPFELTNRAGDPQFRELVAELSVRLAVLKNTPVQQFDQQ